LKQTLKPTKKKLLTETSSVIFTNGMNKLDEDSSFHSIATNVFNFFFR
jgi:hypothetical protein